MAAVEFALAGPFFALAMLGTADMSFFIRAKLKLDTTAATISQSVTQYQQLYVGDFLPLFNAAQLIAGTVPVTGQSGATIISAVTNVNGLMLVVWQQQSLGTGFGSILGTVGPAKPLPNGYVPPVGVTVIVTEVYTTVSPFSFSAFYMGSNQPEIVSSVSLAQPRFGTLASITTGSRS